MIKCLQEFLNPVENPRYILISRKRNFIISQVDYFSLPSAFSSRKKDVEIFETFWKKFIGKCEIIYARNYDGRRILLNARKNAFSGMKREKSKRLSKWQ